MIVRKTPSNRNPVKLNAPPIMIPVNNEDKIVPKYLDVLNRPDATPAISFGELLNKAACILTAFSPLLKPNAANARHTLMTGELCVHVTIHTAPTTISNEDTINAGLGPDLPTHFPAIGEATIELKPKVNIRIPVWNSLTCRTICRYDGIPKKSE